APPPPPRGRRPRSHRRPAGPGHTPGPSQPPPRPPARLAAAVAALGHRPAAIGRELTKLHEEVRRGPLAALREELAARPALKGEFVIVIGGGAGDQAASDPEIQQPPSTREPA
ncbi:MAG: hypothetical protein QM311_12125, partial [Acidobacteriota bacterium]|nr:hypothetical protein [Acidobacteriota bacterium]